MILIDTFLILAEYDINQILPKHGCGSLFKEAKLRALMHFIRSRRLYMSVQVLEPSEYRFMNLLTIRIVLRCENILPKGLKNPSNY